jgi:thiamine biosynthesis lipoprotein
VNPSTHLLPGLDATSAGGAPVLSRSAVFMDTTVTIDVVRPTDAAAAERRVQEAFGWFARVETACSRFDARSELAGLSMQTGVPVPVSPLLFEVLQLALAVAEASDGAFDPTVGAALESAGFDRNYRTGERVASGIAPRTGGGHRDVVLDAAARTVTLRRPLVLDLGGIAKGFAIDLAARELRDAPDFAINAGGDVFARGRSPEGTPWRIGIRHPREPGALIDVIEVEDLAVCTSGDYERPRADGAGHHIVDPRDGDAVTTGAVASATVLAPTAALADALGTAAMVLGLERGVAFLEEHGVEGLLVTASLDRRATRGFARDAGSHHSGSSS